MKQTVQMKRAQEQMAPGVITRDGFLGSDTRNLVDILVADEAEVKRLGVSHGAIAHRMMELRDAGAKGLGEYIDVEAGKYEVRVDSVRGKLPCPFGDPGVFPKTNVNVRNRTLDREILYTDLQIHLILAHGFYQGKGGTFRLEPKDAVEILQVEKEP